MLIGQERLGKTTLKTSSHGLVFNVAKPSAIGVVSAATGVKEPDQKNCKKGEVDNLCTHIKLKKEEDTSRQRSISKMTYRERGDNGEEMETYQRETKKLPSFLPAVRVCTPVHVDKASKDQVRVINETTKSLQGKPYEVRIITKNIFHVNNYTSSNKQRGSYSIIVKQMPEKWSINGILKVAQTKHIAKNVCTEELEDIEKPLIYYKDRKHGDTAVLDFLWLNELLKELVLSRPFEEQLNTAARDIQALLKYLEKRTVIVVVLQRRITGVFYKEYGQLFFGKGVEYISCVTLGYSTVPSEASRDTSQWRLWVCASESLTFLDILYEEVKRSKSTIPQLLAAYSDIDISDDSDHDKKEVTLETKREEGAQRLAEKVNCMKFYTTEAYNLRLPENASNIYIFLDGCGKTSRERQETSVAQATLNDIAAIKSCDEVEKYLPSMTQKKSLSRKKRKTTTTCRNSTNFGSGSATRKLISRSYKKENLRKITSQQRIINSLKKTVQLMRREMKEVEKDYGESLFERDYALKMLEITKIKLELEHRRRMIERGNGLPQAMLHKKTQIGEGDYDDRPDGCPQAKYNPSTKHTDYKARSANRATTVLSAAFLEVQRNTTNLEKSAKPKQTGALSTQLTTASSKSLQNSQAFLGKGARPKQYDQSGASQKPTGGNEVVLAKSYNNGDVVARAGHFQGGGSSSQSNNCKSRCSDQHFLQSDSKLIRSDNTATYIKKGGDNVFPCEENNYKALVDLPPKEEVENRKLENFSLEENQNTIKSQVTNVIPLVESERQSGEQEIKTRVERATNEQKQMLRKQRMKDGKRRKEEEVKEQHDRCIGTDRGDVTAAGTDNVEPRLHCEKYPVQESPQWLCEHYQRRCKLRFPCCNRYHPCHRCHNSDDRCPNKEAKAHEATHLQCIICREEQPVTDSYDTQTCQSCGTKLSEYFCPKCKHFTGVEKKPYHCDKCGICRIHKDRSFHCEVCNVCLDKRLQGKHKCRPDSGHDQCCICLEDAFSGCQILPCSHKVHRDCAKAMIRNGIRTCPVCRHPLYSSEDNSSQ